ncbi:hypothetical protein [Metabacillus litoralis]|uniref:hypothetical protein n=1 Tax=Metabacillus litoralis TaxID=152268 RepID=UPI001CFE7138|nr:hypothetical protein [Metabacillus litoralis]
MKLGSKVTYINENSDVFIIIHDYNNGQVEIKKVDDEGFKVNLALKSELKEMSE